MNEKRTDSEKRSIVDDQLLASCIHCGLCLPACPTYLSTGRETESPRGRIYLVDKFEKGEITLTDRMSEHIESCLGCLGCQTACPSGVDYEKILDSIRPKIRDNRSELSKTLSRLAFKELLPRYALLKIFGAFMRLWQLAFGRDIFNRIFKAISPYTKPSIPVNFFKRLASWEQFAPQVPPYIPLPKYVTPKIENKKSIHARLFSGCVMDVFYNHVNHSTIRLLLKQGHSVEVPKQTCCGALAFHQGEVEIAKDLAIANIEHFGFGQDPIVVTAAGCGAMLKNYKHLFNEEDKMHHKAEEFSNRVFDISEILAAHQFESQPNPPDEKITYHAACHLAHAQNVRDEPVNLLNRLSENLDDRQLIPLTEQENCCGSAGIYNLFNTDLALSILDRKLDHIESTGAGCVVTSNPGCQLQIEAGIKSRKLDVKVKHLAEILDESF